MTMNAWSLLQFIEDVCPHVEIIDSRVFVDRSRIGRDKLIALINEYDSILEAQKWINIVPMSDYFDDIFDDWDKDDPIITKIISEIERSWMAQAIVAGANRQEISVARLIDEDEIIVQLQQIGSEVAPQ